MMKSNLLAEVYLSWMPAWSFAFVAWTAFAGFVLLLAIWWHGGRSQARGRWGLYALRGAVLLILVGIVLGPTIVDEQAGTTSRPAMLFLFDGSQSMLLGKSETRWVEALNFVNAACQTAGIRNAESIQNFRFGHRLEALLSDTREMSLSNASLSSAALSTESLLVSSSPTRLDPVRLQAPEATDSRLADAMRQLLSQIDKHDTAGIVLLSDGRVRASESVEKLAMHLGQSQVPVHVVPIGEVTGSGDVAIVSLVVPSRVRKYTENELQVFFRSYGFTGKQTTLRIMKRGSTASPASAVLATLPIVLSGGAQSASLTFRVNEDPEDLTVSIDPIDDELTERNNHVNTRVEIDRTKVRVLYVERDAQPNSLGVMSQVFTLGGMFNQSQSPELVTVQKSLQADEDIECVMMTSDGINAPKATTNNTANPSLQFPRSRAELFAYDCVVFSDIGPNVLSDEQNEWLAQWLQGRGGGLIITGADALKGSLWTTSPLRDFLPIQLNDELLETASATEIETTPPHHPIWRLVMEQRKNEELLRSLPPLMTAQGSVSKKSTAEVLAMQKDTGQPVIVTHRVGRGRVLVSTASLGGTAFANLAEHWGAQPERVAAKLWRNLVYWTTEASSTGRRRMVVESDKRFYRPGDSIQINAVAYDEAARRTSKYQIWAMFEPASLEDTSLYSPVLWPEGIVRPSEETSPRIAWGEELPLIKNSYGDGYSVKMQLSETGTMGDSGLRVELTAYEGSDELSSLDHGTQVDSSSLAIQVLTDPFEQQNPLPNHELLSRIASVSGGEVLTTPKRLAELLRSRPETVGPPRREMSPAWSQWWLWMMMMGLLTIEWIWRRAVGMA